MIFSNKRCYDILGRWNKNMFGIYNGVFYVIGYRRNYGRT